MSNPQKINRIDDRFIEKTFHCRYILRARRSGL
jgi:hypothetical protein